MNFHEVLNDLMEKHHARPADICAGTGLNRAYVSKIRSGGFVPSDYQTILDIAETIGLDHDETLLLTESFQEAKAPDQLKNAWAAFNAFYTLRPPVSISTATDNIQDLQNGQLVNGKEAVMQAVRSISRDAGKQLCLFITPFQEELKEVCEVVFTSAKSSLSIKWLTLLDNSESGQSMNLSIFINTLGCGLLHNTQNARINGDIQFLIHHAAYPFYLLSDRTLLLLNGEADCALYFDSEEMLHLYTEQFAKSLEPSSPFVNGYDDVEAFLSDISAFADSCSEEDTEVYIIKKHPCLVLESLRSDIHRYIIAENSEKIANMYISFLDQTSANMKRMFNIFPEDGLNDYLHSEEFYEISRHFTKSIPIELRRHLLNKMLSLSESGDIIPHMLRIPGFQDSSLFVVNIWSDGRMILMYDFGERYHIFTAYDKSIADSIISYINSMVRCGILRSKEESVRIIKETLK